LIPGRKRRKGSCPGVCGRQAGFTLLEIMLVVVLVSITVTFVNLKLNPDPARIVEREGERVAALIGQLREESILRGRLMAVEFDEGTQRYGFAVVDSGEWKSLESVELFRSRSFQAPVKASLAITGAPTEREDSEQEEGRSDGRHRIVVDPVGDITPFEMTLDAQGNTAIVSLNAFDEVVVSLESEPE
jgi:general secretion pathway protein H